MTREIQRKGLKVVQDAKDVESVDVKGYSIVVTGTPKFVTLDSLSQQHEITFEQVVELDDRSPPLGTPDIVYFISYVNAAGRPASGALLEGEKVKIQDGTEFTVRYDNRS